jgi:exoribonuclease-2
VPRGTQVQVRLTGIDLIGLDVHAQLLSVLHAADNAAETAEGDDDEDAPAGPIAIAVDVHETPTEGDAA